MYTFIKFWFKLLNFYLKLIVLSNKLNSTEEKTINIKKKPVSGSHDRKNKFDSKVKIERSNKENKTNNEKNNIKLSKAEETKKQSKEKS